MKELLPEPWTRTYVGDDEWVELDGMKNSPFRWQAWRTCLHCRGTACGCQARTRQDMP
ncbi:hypothetical protein ABZW49_03470 [Nonomuraea wenchangensis]